MAMNSSRKRRRRKKSYTYRKLRAQKELTKFLRNTHRDLESRAKRCPKMNLLRAFYSFLCLCIVKTAPSYSTPRIDSEFSTHTKSQMWILCGKGRKKMYCQISGTNENIGAFYSNETHIERENASLCWLRSIVCSFLHLRLFFWWRRCNL